MVGTAEKIKRFNMAPIGEALKCFIIISSRPILKKTKK